MAIPRRTPVTQFAFVIHEKIASNLTGIAPDMRETLLWPSAGNRRSWMTEARDMKVSRVLRLLADDGWHQVRARGSHRQIKHQVKRGLVTVAGKPSDELARATLKSILRQAGLDPYGGTNAIRRDH